MKKYIFKLYNIVQNKIYDVLNSLIKPIDHILVVFTCKPASLSNNQYNFPDVGLTLPAGRSSFSTKILCK